MTTAAPAAKRVQRPAPTTTRAGTVIAGAAAGQAVPRGRRPRGGEQHQVAEPAAAPDARLGHDGDVREHRLRTSPPGAGLGQATTGGSPAAGPSATFAATTPAGGEHAVATSASSSTVVRWAGVRAPANTSSTTRSADAARIRPSASRASATCTGTRTPRPSGSCVAHRGGHRPRRRLDGALPRPGPRRADVPGQGQGAGTEVHDTERAPGSAPRDRRRGRAAARTRTRGTSGRPGRRATAACRRR